MCLYLKVAWKLRIIYLIFLVILLLAWHLRIHYSRLTYYRGLLTINKGLKRRMNDLGSNNVQIEGKTQQSDIFITVKTTGTHANQLNLLFATWIKQAKDEVRFLTIQLNKLSIYVFYYLDVEENVNHCWSWNCFILHYSLMSGSMNRFNAAFQDLILWICTYIYFVTFQTYVITDRNHNVPYDFPGMYFQYPVR